MFYYYGRKKQLAKHYPPPTHPHTIEPFAGAAAYSLHNNHWQNEVTLIEKDPQVAQIWNWLINDATPQSITALPTLKVGERTSSFLHIIHAASKQAFAYKTIKVTPVIERNWEVSKRVMAQNVHKVKHWKILNQDYTAAPNLQATWFIDPPYKGPPGQGYHHGSDDLDYTQLANWILSRQGQVIACEGPYGDYLPFTPLITLTGVAGKQSQEVIYLRNASQ